MRVERASRVADAAPAATTRRAVHPALAWAGIIGPILFTVTFLAQEAFRRADFDWVALPVSALEVGPAGWVQQINFVVFGVLTIAYAVGMHRGMRPTRGGWAGPALLLLTAVGLLIAGAVPLREDAAHVIYTPAVHFVGGGMLFFLGTPAAFIALSLRMRRDPSWRGLAAYTLGSGLVLVGLAVAFMRLAVPDGAPLHDWAGLLQRVIVLVVIFPCRIIISARLLSIARS